MSPLRFRGGGRIDQHAQEGGIKSWRGTPTRQRYGLTSGWSSRALRARLAKAKRLCSRLSRGVSCFMYYRDLCTETMITSGPQIRAIGWLEKEHQFSVAETSVEFRRRLAKLAADWSRSSSACGWPVCAGPHLCSLCGEARGVGEFAVPGAGVLYVAPQMISHYVEAHEYSPPREFIEAVLQCPSFSSAEYAEALGCIAANKTMEPTR
ncbi:DUF7919 family protein [Steroidobacter gossypii]